LSRRAIEKGGESNLKYSSERSGGTGEMIKTFAHPVFLLDAPGYWGALTLIIKSCRQFTKVLERNPLKT
jgi:hypothetical protein